MAEAWGDNAKQFQSAEEAAQALLSGQVERLRQQRASDDNSPLADRDDIEAHLASFGDFDMPGLRGTPQLCALHAELATGLSGV